MSILVDGLYEGIYSPDVTAALATSVTPWSLSGWAKLTGSVQNASSWNHHLGLMTHGYTNWHALAVSSGISNTLSLRSTFSNTSMSANFPSDGGWHYYAICCAGSGATDLKAYVWDDGANLISSGSRLPASFVPDYFHFGGAPNLSDPVHAYWAYGRAWTAALSQAEFEAELASATIVRTSGIYSAFAADSGADVSGNGRDWTLAAGVTSDGAINPSFGGGGSVAFPTFRYPNTLLRM